MKEELINEIKELIKTNPEETVEINPNYLEYFEVEELIEIRNKLKLKKDNVFETNNSFLDEIYEKTKEEKL